MMPRRIPSAAAVLSPSSSSKSYVCVPCFGRVVAPSRATVNRLTVAMTCSHVLCPSRLGLISKTHGKDQAYLRTLLLGNSKKLLM